MADRTTSQDAAEAGSSGTDKINSSSENSSNQNKKLPASTSVDVTTAMGGTIDQDLELTLLGESNESEENLKDVLTNRIVDLDMKLKQTDEFYEKLTQEVAAAKEQYEKERDECEDVVSVAKRNIENQVSKILDLQEKKRELAEKIRTEEDRLMKEEEKTRIELESEEERLTRNIVILQTKLLINEDIKFERDQLLTKIQAMEHDLVDKEKYYQEQLQKANEQIQKKYDRLFQISNNHERSIADQVTNLCQRQQIVAMKHTQGQIVKTQSTYKKTTKKMLQLMDQNKMLQDRNHIMNVHVALQQSLIQTATSLAQESNKEKKEDLIKKLSEKSEDTSESFEDLTLPLNKKIEELKNELFRYQDEEAELSEILKDQRSYLDVIRSQKQSLHDIEQRLIPLADVAEHIVQKGRMVLKQNLEDPAARYDMYQKLSAILMESEELQKYICPEIPVEEQDQKSESFDEEYLPPLKEKNFRNLQRKLPHTFPSGHNYFTRRLDKVEKKILSDLGLLGKYGAKQRRI